MSLWKRKGDTADLHLSWRDTTLAVAMTAPASVSHNRLARRLRGLTGFFNGWLPVNRSNGVRQHGRGSGRKLWDPTYEWQARNCVGVTIRVRRYFLSRSRCRPSLVTR